MVFSKYKCVVTNEELNFIILQLESSLYSVSGILGINQNNSILQAAILELLCCKYLSCDKRYQSAVVASQGIAVNLDNAEENALDVYAGIAKVHFMFIKELDITLDDNGEIQLSTIINNLGYWSLVYYIIYNQE